MDSSTETYTIVNYVVEHRLPGGPWGTTDMADDEPAGRKRYDNWNKSKASKERDGRLEFRLVKRTAAITDEVLASNAGSWYPVDTEPKRNGTPGGDYQVTDSWNV